jgi:hypothetical protein
MISKNLSKFYINGAWVAPLGGTMMGVENPANEEIVAEVALGSVADADRAIGAARDAFLSYTTTPVADRIALLKRILEVYNSREDDFVEAMSVEMGAPLSWARGAQFWAGQVHIESTIAAAEKFHWEEMRGSTRIVREGIGVCALITPWNWPMNQIACKVAPAIVAGCTMVLKPSEIAPLSGALFAEVMHEAGVPAGVFNLVNGTGGGCGRAYVFAPRGGYGVLHRVHPRGYSGGAGGGTDGEACGTGTGRQIAEHHPAHRRSGGRLWRAGSKAALAIPGKVATRRRGCSCPARAMTRRWRLPRPRPRSA